MAQAKEYIANNIVKGVTVKHKTYGEGMVEECSATKLVVHYPEFNETKNYGLAMVVENNILRFSCEEISKRIEDFIPVLKKESRIVSNLSKAEKEFRPYLEYLD